MMQDEDILLAGMRNSIRSGRQLPRTPVKTVSNSIFDGPENQSTLRSPPVPALLSKLESSSRKPNGVEVTPPKLHLKRTPLKLITSGAAPNAVISPSRGSSRKGISIYTPKKLKFTTSDATELDKSDGVVGAYKSQNVTISSQKSNDVSMKVEEDAASAAETIADVSSNSSTDQSLDDEGRRRSSGLVDTVSAKPLTSGFVKAHKDELGKAELEYLNMLKQKARHEQYTVEMDSLKKKLKAISSQQELAQSSLEMIEEEIKSQISQMNAFMDDVEKLGLDSTADLIEQRKLLINERNRLREVVKSKQDLLNDLKSSTERLEAASSEDDLQEEQKAILEFERRSLNELRLLVLEKHQLQSIRSDLISKIEASKAEIARKEAGVSTGESAADVRRLMDRIRLYISRHHLTKMAKGKLLRLMK